MESIPKIAIALEYDGDRAPSVLAKGHDEIANQILKLAHQAQIPIHQDKDLSLVLDQIDLGDQIPEALYLIIAEILSFAYRLSGKHKAFMDELNRDGEPERPTATTSTLAGELNTELTSNGPE